jgi:hypothetical protein
MPNYTLISPADPSIVYVGRTQIYNADPFPGIQFAWSGVRMDFSFTGTSLTFFIEASEVQFDVIIDNGDSQLLIPEEGISTYILAQGLTGVSHSCSFRKRTEPYSNPPAVITSISLDAGAKISPPAVIYRRNIEVIGDSITCGYGILGSTPTCPFSFDTEDFFGTYASLLALQFEANINVVAWSGKGLVRNYGDVNPTSPDPMPTFYPYSINLNQGAEGLWNFSQYRPDVVLINLGTNDFSTQPSPPPQVFIDAYLDFIDYIRKVYPNSEKDSFPNIALLCGPLIGDPCCSLVEQVASICRERGDDQIHYVDLTGVALVDPDDYGCSYHPNINGHRKIANSVIPAVQAITGWTSPLISSASKF